MKISVSKEVFYGLLILCGFITRDIQTKRNFEQVNTVLLKMVDARVEADSVIVDVLIQHSHK